MSGRAPSMLVRVPMGDYGRRSPEKIGDVLRAPAANRYALVRRKDAIVLARNPTEEGALRTAWRMYGRAWPLLAKIVPDTPRHKGHA